MVKELDHLGNVVSLTVHSVEEKSSKISNITMEQRVASKAPWWGERELFFFLKATFANSHWLNNLRKSFLSVLKNKKAKIRFSSLLFLRFFACNPSRCYILYDFIFKIFWNRQNYRHREVISAWLEPGAGAVRRSYKGVQGNLGSRG